MAEVVSQPERDRKTKALLFAVHQFSRQIPGRHRPQNMFKFHPLELHFARNARGILNQSMVHKGGPVFERVRHAHTVCDDEQMVGHPGHEICVQHPVDQLVDIMSIEVGQDLFS